MSIDKYITDNRITCNIYGANGELLIGVGTPISSSIRKRLNCRVWHIEKPSDYIYDNIALLNDDFTPIVEGKNININILKEKAKKIVDLVLNNPVIFSNLKQIQIYDAYTYDHCNQVAYLAVAMGIRLGLDNRELINIAIAALTHDIGKCLVDEKIINKPGKLTDKEMELVRKHSEYGFEIMNQNTDIDKSVLDSILYHHENYNGTGYPNGLKQDEIPLGASIIHVCDVFDALISERPYKQKLNEYDSINILKKDSGIMFNPRAVEVFCSSMQIYKIGSIIELEDGTKVEITDIIKDKYDNILEVHFKEWETHKILVKEMKKNS